MVPTSNLLELLAYAFKEYVLTLIADPGLAVIQIKNEFTPGPDLAAGDIETDELWAGGWPTPLQEAVGSYWIDPTTNEWVAQFAGPTGVQSVISSSNVARTIYGWIIGDIATGDIYGSMRLDTPVPVSYVHHAIAFPEMSFRLPMDLMG